jgi:hypothetical protein
LSRRELLRIAYLGTLTALLGPSPTPAATARSTARKIARYAAFHSLAPGAIEPQGWLRLYLQKQANQLASQLPRVSWPFTDDYWSGMTDTEWWPWEQKAYWIDGAFRCAAVLGDETLLRLAAQAMDYTLAHVDRDGFLGPKFTSLAAGASGSTHNLRWPHTVFFRALTAYAEATEDSRIAALLVRHYQADRSRFPYGGPSRDVTNVEAMLWAYGQTGNRQLLHMAETAWLEFLRSAPPGDFGSGDLHPERVFGNAPIDAHGVTYIEKAKLPAILYMYTGDAAYLRYAVAAQERIFSHHMLIDGIPSTSEIYRGTTALDAHETCDISDHMWTWSYLLKATGDGRWADRMERACFNAGFGALKKDWKALQYFSSPNQVIATDNSSPVPYIDESKSWMAYRPNPGERVACCAGNVHRFFPNYVIGMWMSDPVGGLAAALYGSSTVRATVGARHEPIQVRQETDYPFGDEIHFHVGLARPVRFCLSLRIPAWCREPSLVVNASPAALPEVRRGFVRLEREFSPGDRITLKLPMHTQTTRWPDDGIGIERGPLVFSLPVKEHWTAVVTPTWSTSDFPQWTATPTTPWNYAIALSELDKQAQLEVAQQSMSADPWLEPPVTITVPVKRLPRWELKAPEAHPERLQTPPLQPTDAGELRLLADAPMERVTLVPYGATQLRLTIFPTV